MHPVRHKLHPNLLQGEGKKPKQRPHTSLFQEKERNYNPLKHSEYELPPLGEGEGTEKLKPTIKLKVDDGEIAVLPFIICLF